jgi:hypothetical protein
MPWYSGWGTPPTESSQHIEGSAYNNPLTDGGQVVCKSVGRPRLCAAPVKGDPCSVGPLLNHGRPCMHRTRGLVEAVGALTAVEVRVSNHVDKYKEISRVKRKQTVK